MTSSDLNKPVFLKDLDPQDFLTFGVEQIAYIRQTVIDDQDVYAIHAADGTPLSVMESYSDALSAIYTNDLDASTLQ